MYIARWSGLACMALLFLCAPAYAATFVVNTVGDEADSNPGDGICKTERGTCSLRAALEEASFRVTPDTIRFDIPGEGVKTIEVRSALPASAAVFIDGFSQGDGPYGGPPRIQIDGSRAGQYVTGFYLVLDSVLQGVAIYGFGMHSVVLSESQIAASYVGVYADGTPAPATQDSAILLGGGSAIGCPTVQENAVCASPVVIANNRRDAVELAGDNTTIDNAYIGVDPQGTPMRNGGAGVRASMYMSGMAAVIPRDSHLGIAYPNRIAHNGSGAIVLADAAASSPSNIRVQRTPMYQNAGGALVMGASSSGFPLNDLGDTDVGPNQKLNTPYLKNLDIDVHNGVWTLRGVSRARYIDVYLSDSEPRAPAIKRGSREFLATVDLDSSSNRATGTEYYDVPNVGEDDARAFEIDIPVLANARTLIAHARDEAGNTSILSDAIEGPDLTLDSDGDGLPDVVEIAWGLDPHNPDTDGDSLSDGEEWGDGLLPRDTDGDGVIDALDPDDDGDGIPTLFEIQAVGDLIDLDGDGLPAWRDTDSDGDGIPDAVEYAITGASFDPESGEQPAWNNVDSDGDGICDTPHVQSPDCVGGEDWNADGIVDLGETDPYHPDTDGDGVCDGPNTTDLCATPNDNCPLVPNPDQMDSVGDGIGDACRCDGNACPAGWTQCWADLDGDGFTGTPILLEGDVDCSEQLYAGHPMSAETQVDCDDHNPAIHPDAIEVCDGIDNNCNGLIDSEDPQVATLDPGQTGAIDQIVYDDKDHDGCGMAGTDRYACALDDPGISTNTLDQDDTDGVCCGNGIREEGEACDGEDIGDATCPPGTYGHPICQNNPAYSEGNGSCTIALNAGCVAYKTCYADLDGDGFSGTPRTVPSDRACDSYATDGRPWTEDDEGDCNDNPNDRCAVVTYPGAPELCDGCRNDCSATETQPDGMDEAWFADACDLDGDVPACATPGWVCGMEWNGDAPQFAPVCGITASEGATWYFEDADEDGCGNPTVSTLVCDGEDPPEGWVTNAYDLDDTDGVCCGNGVVDSGETCDGNSIACSALGFASSATATCNRRCDWDISTCDNALCGNGVVDVSVGETCDPEAEGAPENCRENCTFCGDGVIQDLSGETCELDDPDCRETSCTFCGDGIVQPEEGEECEPNGEDGSICPYGETSCTFCAENCTIEQGQTSYCGDGVIDEDEGEACDGEPNCDDDCQWKRQVPATDVGCGCSNGPTPQVPWLLTCVLGALLLHLRRRRYHGR